MRSVAAAVPHAGDADAAPLRALGVDRLKRVGLGERARANAGASASRHALKPTPSANTWPVTVGIARLQRVADAKFKADRCRAFQREFVEKLLLRERALRHAEAAEGAGGHQMGVDRAR